jgi:hypothetical protein
MIVVAINIITTDFANLKKDIIEFNALTFKLTKLISKQGTRF